jgi:hypothetical protein
MTHGHEFWWLLVWACIAWYSTVTVYVAVKGSLDIKEMLERLKRDHEKECQSAAAEVSSKEPSPPR